MTMALGRARGQSQRNQSVMRERWSSSPWAEVCSHPWDARSNVDYPLSSFFSQGPCSYHWRRCSLHPAFPASEIASCPVLMWKSIPEAEQAWEIKKSDPEQAGQQLGIAQKWQSLQHRDAFLSTAFNFFAPPYNSLIITLLTMFHLPHNLGY